MTNIIQQTPNGLSTIVHNVDNDPPLAPLRDGVHPYWDQHSAALSSALWIPNGTDKPDASINRQQPWPTDNDSHSWFSTSFMPAPDNALPNLYSPEAVQAATTPGEEIASTQQSRRIRVYPNIQQKQAIRAWFDASRWADNLTVEILQSGIPAAWRYIAGMVMAELKLLHPEWKNVPYQVKRTAVRDACRAMSNIKIFNQDLKLAHNQGTRADEEFAELHYRSRKNPKQSCYIPDDAVTEHGVYHTILGLLHMAEAIPAGHKEGRLVKERGLYWLTVPHRCKNG